MVCIYCDSKSKTSVVNSRASSLSHMTWRRRQCQHCQSVFTTRETIDLENALRVNSSDGLQPFLRDRLFLDVYKSLSHRKTALKDAGGLTDTIIAQLLPLQTKGVIDISTLKKATHQTLTRFDTVSGVYYAAHYKAS